MIAALPGFLTLSQAAESLGHKDNGRPVISELTLRREIARGNLRASRIGRCLRVTPEELERWRLSTVKEVSA